MMTTNMLGKMKKISGNKKLDRQLRRHLFGPMMALGAHGIRCTRSVWPMLVPKLSVWMSSVVKLLTSSRSVRRLKLRKAFCRDWPARNSRLTSFNSSLNTLLEFITI